MAWLNLGGTIAIGAVIVLALIAVFDIVFRSPRSKRLTNDESADAARSSATHASGPGSARELKRSNGTDH